MVGTKKRRQIRRGTDTLYVSFRNWRKGYKKCHKKEPSSQEMEAFTRGYKCGIRKKQFVERKSNG